MKLYKLISSLIMLLAVIIFGFWFYYPQQNFLEIDYLDVGQGDSSLIKTPTGLNILIDGGYDNKLINRLPENMEPWDKQIDLMILSHPHDDHVTGLVEVLKRYKVKRVLATGVLHSTPNYLAWLKEIRDRKIPLEIIDKPRNIILGEECKLEIIYPDKSFSGEEVENLNNTSIVAKLSYKNTSFLFGGDIEKEVEKELLEKKANLTADILKAHHHGSVTSNTADFISAVNPKIIIFSVGKNNMFNFPDPRVVNRLERLGIKMYRTDKEGTIRFLSDGDEIEKID